MKKLAEKDVERNKVLYDYMTSVNNPDFWFDNHKEVNYEKLLKILDFAKTSLHGKSCLDVGCGTGDFSKLLKDRGTKEYLGIDIYLPSLKKARAKYPNEKFEQIDLLESQPDKKFDFVFCSGALSTKLDSNNYEFIENMIQNMWELSQIGVSFNFLVGLPKDPDIYHYSFNVIEAICRRIIGTKGRLFSLRDIDEAHIYLCHL